jgi:lipooligosaccharide transport system permease protein
MAGALRVFEHRALQYRRTARASLFGSFVSPVMFLAAMGVGLGGYVDRTDAAAVGGVRYLVWLAPGLLVATVMQAGAFEATYRMLDGLHWRRTFHAMVASPIEPRAVAVGNLAWIAARLATVAIAFSVVVLLFGAARDPLLVLAMPVAVITGMAFAGPIAAYAARIQTPDNFNALFRFGITPLFLLSGTFFPLDGLPPLIQAVAWLSPLWHGVELARGLALGSVWVNPGAAIAHLTILILIAAVGAWLAARMFERRLSR